MTYRHRQEVQNVTGWAKMYYCFKDLDRYDSLLMINYLIDTEGQSYYTCLDEGYKDYYEYTNTFIQEKLGPVSKHLITQMLDDLVAHQYIYIHHAKNNPCGIRYIKLNYDKLDEALGVNEGVNEWVNEWVNEGVNEWVNEGSEKPSTKQTTKRTNDHTTTLENTSSYEEPFSPSGKDLSVEHPGENLKSDCSFEQKEISGGEGAAPEPKSKKKKKTAPEQFDSFLLDNNLGEELSKVLREWFLKVALKENVSINQSKIRTNKLMKETNGDEAEAIKWVVEATNEGWRSFFPPKAKSSTQSQTPAQEAQEAVISRQYTKEEREAMETCDFWDAYRQHVDPAKEADYQRRLEEAQEQARLKKEADLREAEEIKARYAARLEGNK